MSHRIIVRQIIKESSYTDLRIFGVERDEVWRGPNLSPYQIALIGFRLMLKPHPFTPFRLALRIHTSFFPSSQSLYFFFKFRGNGETGQMFSGTA